MNIRFDNEINQLLRKEKEKCVGCKLCMDNCPMLDQYCNSPDELLTQIVEDQQVAAIIPFSCALCGYCTQVCPQMVDLNKVFLELRMDIVKKNKGVPKAIPNRAVKFHQKNSFSKLFTTDAKGLDENEMKRVFFPGCALTAFSPELVIKIYDYLRDKLPGIGIMLNCCGKPTHSMGDMEKFNKYYATVQDTFDTNGVEEIIVACQNCYKAIGKNSPRQRITSLWDIIAEVGIPKEKVNKGRETHTTFAIHDPCPTRENSHIHDSVRKITQELGLKIKEMEFSRERTLCCGSGGMLGVTNSALALKQMNKRANQTEEEYIISYCQECVESMRRGGKKSIHILDLLFRDEVYLRKEFDQEDISTFKKWTNRYIAKVKVNRYKGKGGKGVGNEKK